ncbi:tetratricopeptide repeat protein [Noviherbaspirillum aridicola]|uniref:Tetratricopeptide repeat protein n=1 Tax=Noviherbaspirillum aridicola TaxID=2849687 RepID=A0ABQ4Q2F8_9BURK|nr:tetratricopeptide repeat protein [Noviherbaspirillum aridicola]GIZ51216.1 hypothetical protein NCCP691_12300 [Noviherbaspirillum aridicola]
MAPVNRAKQASKHQEHETAAPVQSPWQIAMLRRQLGMTPCEAPEWEEFGRALLIAGKPQEAEQAFRRVLRLLPGSPGALVGLARALSLQGYCIDAADLCHDALSKSPGDPMLTHTLAESLRQAGLPHCADRMLQEAVAPGCGAAGNGAASSSRAWGNATAGANPTVADLNAPRVADSPELLQMGEKLRIGLVWANAGAPASLLSTVPLAEFAPLADVPGTVFVLLQPGQAMAEGAHPPDGMDAVALPDVASDETHLTSVLRQLDLLITADVGIARLSASFGRPTWLLTAASSVPPPGMNARTFRQERRGSWSSVIQALLVALRDLVEKAAADGRIGETDRLLLAALHACEGMRYPEAERIYRDLLSRPGDHLGRSMLAARRYMERSRRFEFADTITPPEGCGLGALTWYSDLAAWSLARRDRHKEAFRVWQGVCAQPVPPLGVLLHCGDEAQRTGDWTRAIETWEAASTLYPDASMIPLRAAMSYKSAGDQAKTGNALRRAVEISPWDWRARLELGILYREQGNLNAALRNLQIATYLNPEHAYAWLCLGHALYLEKRYRTGAACFEHACRLEPSHFAAAHLGYCAFNCQEFEVAHAALALALKFAPDDWDAMYFNAVSLTRLQRHDEATAILEAIRDRNPGYFDQQHVRQELCILYLRNPTPARSAACRQVYWARRRTAAAQWHGQPLHGKTLLVFQDAGFGDSIQGLRFLRKIRQEHRPARVILAVWPELTRLYQGYPDADEVHNIFSIDLDKIECDFSVDDYTMMLLCGGAPSAMTAPVPYLTPEPGLVDKWRERLKSDRKFKVGLVWQGNTAHTHDKLRSIALRDWSPLMQVPNISFYALQKGDAVLQAFEAEAFPLAVPDVELSDFADTAALMATLDLVITIDSSPAHLAGAIGMPVWVLLPPSTVDWRWCRQGAQQAWYPRMRLFRPAPEETSADVIRRIAAALREYAAQESQGQKVSNRVSGGATRVGPLPPPRVLSCS